MPKSAVAEALAQGKLPPVNLVKDQDSGCQTSSQNRGPRDSKMGPRWFVEGGAGYMSFLAISQLQNLEICLMLTMNLLTSLTGCRDI
jgi:hypothetical protein